MLVFLCDFVPIRPNSYQLHFRLVHLDETLKNGIRVWF